MTIIRSELPSLCYFTGCPLNTIPSLSHFLNQSLATTETLFTYYLHVHRALFSLINGENLYIFLGLHTWNINGNRTEAIERVTDCFRLAKPTLILANLELSSLPEQALSLCYFLRDLDCSYNRLNAPATSLPASLKGVNYSHNPFHQTGVFIPNDVPDSSV